MNYLGRFLWTKTTSHQLSNKRTKENLKAGASRYWIQPGFSVWKWAWFLELEERVRQWHRSSRMCFGSRWNLHCVICKASGLEVLKCDSTFLPGSSFINQMVWTAQVPSAKAVTGRAPHPLALKSNLPKRTTTPSPPYPLFSLPDVHLDPVCCLQDKSTLLSGTAVNGSVWDLQGG